MREMKESWTGEVKDLMWCSGETALTSQLPLTSPLHPGAGCRWERMVTHFQGLNQLLFQTFLPSDNTQHFLEVALSYSFAIVTQPLQKYFNGTFD